MRMNLEPIRVSVCVALCISAMSGCTRPNGPMEFRGSQHAVQQLDHLTIEWTRSTGLGVFTEIAEFDCGLRYYHYRYVKDLSAKGIEEGVTQSQGRPMAHQQEERIFVNGRSSGRNSASWENAKNDDTRAWGGASSSYDPAQECESMHHGKDNSFVPHKRIIDANQIEYRGTRNVDNVQCHEYQVTYPDVVYTDTMKTTQLGPGSSYSEREQVTRPVQSIICIGVKDLLPRHVTQGDLSVRFSYGLILPLPDPAQAAPPSPR
jgi:hypothetical protein